MKRGEEKKKGVMNLKYSILLSISKFTEMNINSINLYFEIARTQEK